MENGRPPQHPQLLEPTRLERLLFRLEARIATLVESGELPVPIVLSAGVTRYPDDGEDAETLFGLADLRLYEAKRASAA